MIIAGNIQPISTNEVLNESLWYQLSFAAMRTLIPFLLSRTTVTATALLLQNIELLIVVEYVEIFKEAYHDARFLLHQRKPLLNLFRILMLDLRPHS